MRRSATSTACLIALLGASAGAAPRSLPHVVAAGETVEGLAAEYYGDRSKALFIRERNALGEQRVRAGETLAIPTATRVRVEKGDTLATIAERWLGSPRRARFLAEWNGLRETEKLEVGSKVLVPFHLVHRVRAPESLASLAKTYYGDAAQGRLLAAYNFRSKGLVLARGELLVIPVPHVQIRTMLVASGGRAGIGRKAPPAREPGTMPPMAAPEHVDAPLEGATGAPAPAGAATGIAGPGATHGGAPGALAMAAPATAAGMMMTSATGAAATGTPAVGTAATPRTVAAATPAGRVGERLSQAERAFYDGSYEEAQAQLARLLAEGSATSPQQMAIHRLLGFVYVALDSPDDALREFREVLARDPALTLDETVSPKIRLVFERARGRN